MLFKVQFRVIFQINAFKTELKVFLLKNLHVFREHEFLEFISQ
jgi:hypothetical protein